MCGIIGSINHPLNLPSIQNAMQHRGPDEQGHFQFQNLELFMLRLAIQDIENGQQPVHFLNRYTIIFNGEIYNHQSLRERFNLSCQTNSDTETLIQLYHKLGEKFLHELDGMFAFAIFDKDKNEVFLARDRAGKKPLYLFNDGQKIVFASELNALRSTLDLSINESHINNYLRLGFHFRKQTPYQSVTEFENGHWAKINLNTLKIEYQKWWDIFDFYQQKSTLNFDEALEKTDSILKESVRRRLVSSDLEVGTFLSGGIDSGLVTAMASRSNSKLKTFTVSFSDGFDEAPLAKLVAQKYQTDHTEIKISFDHLKNDIEGILGNYGEPFYDSSAIPSYYVSKAAKEHVTVILNGDGADELFGGYRRYVPFAKVDLFKMPKAGQQIFKSLNSILPPSHDKKSKYNYLNRLVNLASKNGIEKYISASSDILEGFDNQLKMNKLKDFEPIFNRIKNSNLSGLKKLMYLDFEITLFGDFLVKMDIATMSNSLEGRSPFLGKELLEFAPTLRDDFKIKNTSTKFILRELAKKYLPKELIHQPKRGFEVPLKKWVEEDLKEVIFSNLGEHCYAENFVEKNFIQKLKNNKVRIGGEKRAKILWTLFSLGVWKNSLKN